VLYRDPLAEERLLFAERELSPEHIAARAQQLLGEVLGKAPKDTLRPIAVEAVSGPPGDLPSLAHGVHTLGPDVRGAHPATPARPLDAPDESLARSTDRARIMSRPLDDPAFSPLQIAILTVSDTRTESDDTSGQLLAERASAAGHHLVARQIVPDDIYRLRAVVSAWIADPGIQVVISTGGTGVTGRDSTPEAIAPLLDKPLEGFGELFRSVSFDEIGTSTLQSRALAGLANGTFIFCLPGSSGACRTAWDRILMPQLDTRTRPCNFAQLIPRLLER
jgi:molybdenum cofactor biosynthesis protein B